MCRHRRHNLTPATWRNLGCTNGTYPDGAAGLKTSETSCFELMGFPDLDFFAFLAQTQALVSAGLWQKFTRYRLEDEALNARGHRVNKAQNLASFGVNSRFVFGFRISTKGRSAFGASTPRGAGPPLRLTRSYA